MQLGELHWTAQSGYPILASLQLLPLVAVLVVTLIRSGKLRFPVVLGLALAELLLAWDLYRHFDPANPLMQLGERLELLPALNYHVAADGMTVLFVLLTAVLTLLVILYARVRDLGSSKRFMATPLKVMRLPVRGTPNRSPSWVPSACQRNATRSSSAVRSSTVKTKSGTRSNQKDAALLISSSPSATPCQIAFSEKKLSNALQWCSDHPS